MDYSKTLGIVIIIAIIFSIIVVGYGTFVKDSIQKEKTVETVFDQSQLSQSDNSSDNSNGNISKVNLNIHQSTGGVNIKFADTDNAYNITSKGGKKAPTITNKQKKSTLNVNVDSNDTDLTIVLSNKYKYNINCDIIAGGFDGKFTEKSKVNSLKLDVTAGGVNLDLNGGKLSKVSTKIATGGLNIKGMPKGVTKVKSKIEVGGININLKKPVADVSCNIKVGGLNPSGYQKISETEYKGNEYDSSKDKLKLKANVRLGGINTQSFK
ncbi:MAG: hypothetical protein IJJ47_05510 [Methanosphaera sp.]|nr:hypothetical protein [Methanosphaera sp.]